jgi:hypothetical protein
VVAAEEVGAKRAKVNKMTSGERIGTFIVLLLDQLDRFEVSITMNGGGRNSLIGGGHVV